MKWVLFGIALATSTAASAASMEDALVKMCSKAQMCTIERQFGGRFILRNDSFLAKEATYDLSEGIGLWGNAGFENVIVSALPTLKKMKFRMLNCSRYIGRYADEAGEKCYFVK